jgi:hypothetical protein
MKKNGAIAVVQDSDVFVIDVENYGKDEVSEKNIRKWINADLVNCPQNKKAASKIKDFKILQHQGISSANYAQDMMSVFVTQMRINGWNEPVGLRVFEKFSGSKVIYIAYGT